MPMTLAAATALSWIATWTASPQAVWGEDLPFPTLVPAQVHDQTFRQVARVSVGGRRVRLVLSNDYGKAPLVVDAVHVGMAGQGDEVAPGTDRVVTFDGRAEARIMPGAPLVSDPIDLVVAPLSRLSVSTYVRDATPITTFHWEGRQTAYFAQGNQVAATVLGNAAPTTARLFLSGIQVDTSTPTQAVVAIGDSITDGNGATIDADARWPDYLAERLAPRGLAVLNAGISGGRLLSDGMGVSALARFDRDVLAQPGVTTVVVALGINDISWPGTAFEPRGVRPTDAMLVAGYRQLIARAHARGVRIVAATLTPFEGALPDTPLADYYHPDKDALRQRVNAWLRTCGEFDAILDFDVWLRDAEHPARLDVEFDSGDHLHPGDRGNRALAQHIDLRVLFPDAADAPSMNSSTHR